MKKLNLKNSSLLTSSIVVASAATAGFIFYYLIKKWKSKNKQRPFAINTSMRQYIGFTKGNVINKIKF
jgi:phosphotransferase system  glucose/maltose/N-acetylglucosamine-specific IIC component